ncbi:AMP-binding protein [bacterium]|nr:AMP-binding protein [bacterium]
MGLYDYTLYSILKRNARIHRQQTAWICGTDHISHQAFLATVDRLTAGLLATGLKKGDRIAVLSQNNLEFVYLYGAAAKMGAIMLPINWRLQPEEVEYIIQDGAPEILFVSEDFHPLATTLLKKTDRRLSVFNMGPACGDFAAFTDLLTQDGSGAVPDVSADDPFVIIHTAAVAGRPRGATLTHRGLILANIQGMVIWQLSPQDCHLCMLPLFHVAGLGVSLNVMQAGGKNLILAKFDPVAALKHIQEDRVSLFIEFPPMLSTLLDQNTTLGYDLSSLRVLGGLDMPETIKRYEEATGGVFWTAFGQSETSGFVTFAPFFEKPGSAGRPAFLAEVEIMDPLGRIMESGQSGEIVVRGPLVFQGYWNLETDNAYTFRDGWHHTGDRGRFDEEGYLFYEGRMPEKELIKPGGENVYPAEVEQAILEHPGVREVSVIGVPDKKWGEAVKAVCVLETGISLTAPELIAFVAEKIARFKKPQQVVFVSSLPRTADGAIDREAVKAEHGKPQPV